MGKTAAKFTILAILLACSGCDGDTRVQLVQADSEREANRVLVALVESGVRSGDIQRATEQRHPVFRIVVDPQDLGRARLILVENNLPRAEESGFEKLLANTGLIPTAADEQARLMFAISSELQRTLETFDTIIAARVHIVLPSAEPLSEQVRSAPSATVLLKRRNDAAARGDDAGAAVVPPVSDEEVHKLVAGAVPNLKPENVRVVWTTAAHRDIPAATTRPVTAKHPGPTVLVLSGVTALLLVTLIGVILQLVKANRVLNGAGRRPAGTLSHSS